MSLEFTGADNCWVRIFPTGLNENAVTATFAWKRITDRNATSTLLGFYNTGSDLMDAIYLASNGDDLQVSSSWGGAVSSTLATVSTGTWYHCALVGNGGTYTLYFKDGAGTITSTTVADPQKTIDQILLGSEYGAGFAGRIANFKLWSTNLTSGEVATELAQAAPSKTANLIGYASFAGADFATAQTSNTSNQTYFNTWWPGPISPTVNGDNPTYGSSIVLAGSDTLPGSGTVVITSNNGSPTWNISINENSTGVGTVSATGTGAITYSIVSGYDGAKFAINSSTGVLTFASAPNYEIPTDSNADNIYVVQVRATDTTPTTADQLISVTVNNVLETLSLSGYNSSINNNAQFQVTVKDEGNRVVNGAVITWNGGPSGAVGGTTNAAGVATVTAPNNVGTFTMTATSGAITGTGNVTIISAASPTFTSGSILTVDVISGTTAVTTIAATSPNNGTIAYTIAGGADSSKFSVNSSSGALTFNSAPNYASPTDSNADNTYIVVIQAYDGFAASTQTVNVRVNAAVLSQGKVIKAYVHRKAMSASGINGVVWLPGTGGNLLGTQLFEFSGINFSASLVNNQAELQIPMSVAVQNQLGSFDKVKVYLYTSSMSTPIFDASVYPAVLTP